ncbi:glycoside hydrolase family 75 protein [Hypomontagnella monticulosa]|nr:glycoside hydrolase family 75 protein [Hypomontagnella monticulosa]
MSLKSLLGVSMLLGASLARDVPSNVRNFYNGIKSKGQCSSKLASGFYSEYNNDNSFAYCGDHLQDSKVIYIQGKNGQFANMDIDCDGTQGSAADDGRCGKSDDTQSITSFADTVRGYGKGVRDLDANIHPYVVFGNVGSKPGFKEFDPQKHGIEPLSVMAVVCGDKLIYGVWGDENGDDGEKSVVGEASISLATACYGKSINGNSGHDENDVLYIAFTGSDAVPGKNGAKWNAKNYNEFESSIQGLGDKLIQRIK